MVQCLIWARTWWLKSSEHRYGDLHCRSTVAPHRGGIGDAISCEIRSKQVCWASHSSIYHNGSHETWFEGKTFSSITRPWAERCGRECTERCMQSASCSVAFPTCPSQMGVLSTGVCSLETLSLVLRRAGERPTSRYGMGWTECNAHVWPFLLSRLRYGTGLARHA
jgi:hypothetical protein